MKSNRTSVKNAYFFFINQVFRTQVKSAYYTRVFVQQNTLLLMNLVMLKVVVKDRASNKMRTAWSLETSFDFLWKDKIWWCIMVF